jgi:ketosteroid isomerase-like protein
MSCPAAPDVYAPAMDEHPNAAVIRRFYEAFTARDAATMNACYADDVEFRDPAFGTLVGDEARSMWTLLCERGKDLRIAFSGISATDAAGSAHWEAWYTFAATGKPVHNIVDARFLFRDGLIAHHEDQFDFPRWAGQALGMPGKLFGRLSFFQSAFRAKARALLKG